MPQDHYATNPPIYHLTSHRNALLIAVYSDPAYFDLPSGFIPATVVNVDGGVLDQALVDRKLESFEATDDVFDRHFASFLPVFRNIQHHQTPALSSSFAHHLLALGTTRIAFINERDLENASDVTEGPFLVSPHGLLPVWKLFPDTCGAFVESVIENTIRPVSLLPTPLFNTSHPQGCNHQ